MKTHITVFGAVTVTAMSISAEADDPTEANRTVLQRGSDLRDDQSKEFEVEKGQTLLLEGNGRVTFANGGKVEFVQGGIVETIEKPGKDAEGEQIVPERKLVGVPVYVRFPGTDQVPGEVGAVEVDGEQKENGT